MPHRQFICQYRGIVSIRVQEFYIMLQKLLFDISEILGNYQLKLWKILLNDDAEVNLFFCNSSGRNRS